MPCHDAPRRAAQKTKRNSASTMELVTIAVLLTEQPAGESCGRQLFDPSSPNPATTCTENTHSTRPRRARLSRRGEAPRMPPLIHEQRKLVFAPSEGTWHRNLESLQGGRELQARRPAESRVIRDARRKDPSARNGSRPRPMPLQRVRPGTTKTSGPTPTRCQGNAPFFLYSVL